MDEEDVISKEVIEFSDVVRLTSEFNHIVNDINKRFMWVMVISLICITVIVGSLAGFYFLSGSYSGVDQKAVQSEGRQEVRQSIIK